jgi:hypothetical protein
VRSAGGGSKLRTWPNYFFRRLFVEVLLPRFGSCGERLAGGFGFGRLLTLDSAIATACLYG